MKQLQYCPNALESSCLTHTVLNELVYVFSHECPEGSLVWRTLAVGEDDGCVHHTTVNQLGSRWGRQKLIFLSEFLVTEQNIQFQRTSISVPPVP